MMVHLLFDGQVVAAAAIRLVRLAAPEIIMAFRPIVVEENWQNRGMAKLLVTRTRSVISEVCSVASVAVLVKATQRSWRMWRKLGAVIDERAVGIAHAWQNQEGCTSFGGLKEGCVDAIISAEPSSVGRS